MLECYSNVNSSQAVQVIGAKVSRPAAITIIFGRGQAVVEVGERARCKLLSLINSILCQCPFNKLGSLPRLVAVVTRKNYGRYTCPHFGRTQVLADDAV